MKKSKSETRRIKVMKDAGVKPKKAKGKAEIPTIAPNPICLECSGTGLTSINALCPVCKGTGRI